MATPAYGLDADLAAKAAAKYDPELEKAVCDWISAVTGQQQEGTIAEWLHDGKVLCALANAIKPGSVKKVNTMNAPFKQRENITYFQKFMRDNGMPETAMFGTDDLYDAKNLGSFVTAINTFGGVIQGSIPQFTGPKLGVAVEAHVQDGKRAGGVATQSGGLAGTMEVQKLTQGRREVAGGTNTGVKDGASNTADAAGLDKDLAAKKAAKYDPQLEAEVVKWIEAITGESKGGASAHDWLKSGQVLCRLANKIKPGAVANINTMATPFKERENITYFQKAMRDAGVPESQLFGTDDLYEASDMGQFARSVVNFGGAVQTSNPSLPKLGAAVSHAMGGDAKRDSGVVNQYEAMQRNMQVERPKNTGITSGADAGAR
jgi:uncharacterized protein with ACT and thioredoxin-like domain